jgi:hypothetical protein
LGQIFNSHLGSLGYSCVWHLSPLPLGPLLWCDTGHNPNYPQLFLPLHYFMLHSHCAFRCIRASCLAQEGLLIPSQEQEGLCSKPAGLECVFLAMSLPHKSGQKSLRTPFVFSSQVSVIWIKGKKWVLIAWSSKWDRARSYRPN